MSQIQLEIQRTSYMKHIGLIVTRQYHHYYKFKELCCQRVEQRPSKFATATHKVRGHASLVMNGQPSVTVGFNQKRRPQGASAQLLLFCSYC